MNKPDNQIQRRSKFRRLGFYIVINLLMIVMVGKGVLHLSKGAAAGYFELLLGTALLICMPWIQDNARDTNPDWEMPLLWVVLMGCFAIYAYIGMINPFI